MNFDLGINYEEFIKKADAEHRQFIDELEVQGKLDMSDKSIDKIKSVNSNVDIVVITETRCKDSATVMPFLTKLCDMNKNLNVKFFRKEGNEEVLRRLTGEEKVPSIIILDKHKNVNRKYVEFPYKLKMRLESSPIEETQAIIDSMRAGDFNKEIQEDLIKLITGDNYTYISFTRKDK